MHCWKEIAQHNLIVAKKCGWSWMVCRQLHSIYRTLNYWLENIKKHVLFDSKMCSQNNHMYWLCSLHKFTSRDLLSLGHLPETEMVKHYFIEMLCFALRFFFHQTQHKIFDLLSRKSVALIKPVTVTNHECRLKSSFASNYSDKLSWINWVSIIHEFIH